MTEAVRARLIALLEQLDTADHSAVLEAAREIRTLRQEEGLVWESLIAPADAGVEEDMVEHEEAVADAEAAGETAEEPIEEAPLPSAEPAAPGTFARDADLIDRVLARKDLSDSVREELTGLRADIDTGEFSEMDASYVRALAKRMGWLKARA